jgi:hypothetical protein
MQVGYGLPVVAKGSGKRKPAGGVGLTVVVENLNAFVDNGGASPGAPPV